MPAFAFINPPTDSVTSKLLPFSKKLRLCTLFTLLYLVFLNNKAY
nr:MAG TPA: hypothetical protein [Caudoviricetes sp.]